MHAYSGKWSAALKQSCNTEQWAVFRTGESVTRQNHETRCFPQTLTPLQGARLLVKSFPWYPDIPAVCIWISALAGNTAAITELRRLLPDETIEPANC